MATCLNKATGGTWGFCDACGRPFRGGQEIQGYVLFTRDLARHGWQPLPFLELYCPQHRLAVTG